MYNMFPKKQSLFNGSYFEFANHLIVIIHYSNRLNLAPRRSLAFFFNGYHLADQGMFASCAHLRFAVLVSPVLLFLLLNDLVCHFHYEILVGKDI